MTRIANVEANDNESRTQITVRTVSYSHILLLQQSPEVTVGPDFCQTLLSPYCARCMMTLENTEGYLEFASQYTAG
jgi:hypothetical protein